MFYLSFPFLSFSFHFHFSFPFHSFTFIAFLLLVRERLESANTDFQYRRKTIVGKEAAMMQFLVTSLAAQTVNQFDAYFTFRNISASQTLFVNDIFFVSTQYPQLFHHDADKNRVSFCLSDDTEIHSRFVGAYESNSLLSTTEIDCGCGMFDFNTNSLTWLEEDTGRIPVWFATKAKTINNEFPKSTAISFILTDDLIVVNNIASHYVSTFPPGNLMSFSLDSFGMTNLQEKTSFRKAPSSTQTLLLKEDAENAIQLVLAPYLQRPEQYTIVIEYDPQYYSSRLLLCILFQMNLTFRVIRTRPTYLEFDNEAFGYDPLYRKLLGMNCFYVSII